MTEVKGFSSVRETGSLEAHGDVNGSNGNHLG
jgi:hypothetical protein